MKLIVEIDSSTMESKVLFMGSYTSKEIVRIICDYFNISVDDLTTPPLIKSGDHIMIRKFLIFFLKKRGDSNSKIAKLLGYETVNNIASMCRSIEEKFVKDPKMTRTFSNLAKILGDYNIKDKN